jgi:hypothetical protein
MVTIRKPSQQSVILDYLIIGIIPVNALSVLATDCREMSTTGYREEEGTKELTGNAPRTAVAKAVYLATTNRIATSVMRFLGFHMYNT